MLCLVHLLLCMYVDIADLFLWLEREFSSFHTLLCAIFVIVKALDYLGGRGAKMNLTLIQQISGRFAL